MNTNAPESPDKYKEYRDWPSHLPDPKLLRFFAGLLVGIFLIFVLLVLLGS